MDVHKLNDALTEIASLKNKLNEMNYNNSSYDDVEEELHDMEDELMDEFGDALEDVLIDVHEEVCPDSEVLLPIAYLAHTYKCIGKDDSNNPLFDIDNGEGVIVDSDEYDKQLTRLVLVPGPTRLVLNIGRNEQKEVWVG